MTFQVNLIILNFDRTQYQNYQITKLILLDRLYTID